MPSEQLKQEIARAHQDIGDRVRPNTLVDGKPYEPSKSVSQLKLQEKVARLRRNMLRIGERPATVLNLRPFPFTGQGQHACNYPLVPAPIDGKPKAFTKHVIPGYEISVFTTEFGEQDVMEVLAIDIAEDIKQQQNKIGKRGIIIYMGDRDPEKYEPDPYNPEKRDLPAEIEAEMEAMVGEAKLKIQEAEDYWAKADGSSRKHITDEHRTWARFLRVRKMLERDPVWLLEARLAADVQEPCPSCGAEPLKDAFSCKACAWILKPDKAYKLGAIGPDDNSLLRLDRATLDSLGLKEVPTLAEFRKLQLRERNKKQE